MPDLETDNSGEKLFYRIREVSKQLNVTASMLRFWEKDIDCLKQISKNKKGDRLYSAKNIGDLKIIHHLVKEKGYTLQGANAYMNKHGNKFDKNMEVRNSLLKIKSFLENLKENL